MSGASASDAKICTEASPAPWGAPLVYVNQVGANDEVLFDGGSFACDASGTLIGRLPQFRTSFGVVEVELGGKGGRWISPGAAEREDQAPSDIEVLSRALVTGIRDYFERTGFKTAILGLSGGIDSAVVATLAAKALGGTECLGCRDAEPVLVGT